MFVVILRAQITPKLSNTSCGYIKDYTDTKGKKLAPYLRFRNEHIQLENYWKTIRGSN